MRARGTTRPLRVDDYSLYMGIHRFDDLACCPSQQQAREAIMSTSTPPRRGRPPKKAKLDQLISRESSPDPLAIIPGSEPESSSAPLKRAKRQQSEEEEELDQIVVVVPSPNKAPRSAATSARKPRTPRKQASAAPESTAEADEAEPKPRTPKKGTASGTISTPRKRSSATPTRATPIKATPTKATPTKATPSRANPAKAKGKAPPKSPTSESSESEVAHDGQDLVSAVQFRRNEAVKAGRDARNFNWSGDVNAPRTTRKSAAVVDHEVDRYESAPMDEDEAMDGPADATAADKPADDVSTLFEGPSADQPAAPPRKAQSLGAGPTEMLEQVLKRLSGVIPMHPAPFDDEDRGMLDGFDPSWYLEAGIKGAKPVKGSDSAVNGGDDTAKSLGRASTTGNEALRHLVTLLRGTVERGEGNSCLMMGSKGCGKTRTINRAISLLSRTARQWTSASQGRPDIRPIVVRLSGLAQINDMLAIREMGRQIAEGEGQAFDPEDDDLDLDIAPTTLPSQLLAQLSASSPRAIIIVLDNFELFTEHARQALLYCLFDVVQSIRTGPMQTTGRGVAVIGATSRIDTPLLLEKRVKSRFSQRVYRVVSPLAGADPDTRVRLLRSALLPWYGSPAEDDQVGAQYTDDSLEWMGQWETQVNVSPTLCDCASSSADHVHSRKRSKTQTWNEHSNAPAN